MSDKFAVAEEQQLQRGIHPWMANLIALGGIIGSCYFIASGWLVAELGVSAAFAYMIGGLIIWSVMQSFAELLVNIPRQGSFVSYSREFISPIWAVGTGWSYWFNWVAYVPSEAVAGGIIMTQLFGNIPMFENYTQAIWAFIFLAIITFINLSHVENFGMIESVLAILKISAVAIFSVLALLLVIGAFGGHAVGTTILFPSGHANWGELFPSGIYPLFGYLALILVNFQGSEIIGLAAAETQDLETTIPKACRQVTDRIIGIFVIPIIFLVLILSRTDSGLDGSMFAAALDNYATSLRLPWLHWVAAAFSVIVLSAAFSCANSGMFGTVRSMYALSFEGMAPKFFSKLNKKGVPKNATIFTLICCWVALAINVFATEDAYAILLSVSAFTGTICWISICLSQVMFRRRVLNRGYSVKDLKAPAPFSPFLPGVIGVGLETLALLLMLGDPRVLFGGGSFSDYLASANHVMQIAFICSLIALVIPMIVFAIAKLIGKVNLSTTLSANEKTFDELFPSKN